MTNITDITKKRIGIFAKNLNTGKTHTSQEFELFGTASIIKICIALTLFSKANEGKINLDKPIKVQSQDESKKLGKYANGLLSYLNKGKSSQLTLRLACYLMLKLSDNAATNIVLKYVSQKEINDYLKAHDLSSTQITCETLDPPELERTGNLLGITNAQEMSLIMEKIVTNGFFNDEKINNELLNMMENNYPSTTFDRYLPTYWNSGAKEQKISKIVNKGGSFPKFELLAETGCIFTDKEEQIVVSVFTQGITFNGASFPCNLNPDHPGNLLIAKTVKEVFELLY